MDTTPGTAPGTHDQPAHHPTDGSSRLHTPKDQLIVPGAAQDHRRENRKGQIGEKVPDHKDRLQAEQAGTGKDVTKAISCFLEEMPLSLAAHFCDNWLGNMDKQQGANRHHSGDQVDDE